MPPQLKNFTATSKEFLPNNTINNIDYTSTSKESEKKYFEEAEAGLIFK